MDEETKENRRRLRLINGWLEWRREMGFGPTEEQSLRLARMERDAAEWGEFCTPPGAE